MLLETFLLNILKANPVINIVGGSPLVKWVPSSRLSLPPYAISINGILTGAYAAAINASKSDLRRVAGWDHVISPLTDHGFPANVVTPGSRYPMPGDFPSGVQPTTTFRLLLICDFLKLPTNLYGVCGWASKWHDGDWEMHFIKRYMKTVTVHDPRPKW